MVSGKNSIRSFLVFSLIVFATILLLSPEIGYVSGIKPRTLVWLFDYKGDKATFSAFGHLLENHIQSVRYELLPPENERYSYLWNLCVREANEPNRILTDDGFKTWWRANDRVLETYDGCILEVNGSPGIQTTIRLDPFFTKIRLPDLTYPIKATDIPRMKAENRLITIYALAQDAKVSIGDRDIVTTYLDEAFFSACDLESKGSQLGRFLKEQIQIENKEYSRSES